MHSSVGRPSSVLFSLLVLSLLTMSILVKAQQSIPDSIAQRAVACSACHGKEGRATSEGFFPRIAGKPAGYLYNQLVNFREARRKSAAMTYMVAYLSDDYLRELADYFSALRLPYPPPQDFNTPEESLLRGRQLVFSGDKSKNVPACVACHGKALTGVVPAIPALVGLPRDYLNAQFGAWLNHTRKAAEPDCMAQIISRLNRDDFDAASTWLASQTVPEDSSPAAVLPESMPITCGSMPKRGELQ